MVSRFSALEASRKFLTKTCHSILLLKSCTYRITYIFNEALPGVMENREIMSFISGEQGNISLKMELRTQKPILWNHEGTFKLLSIEYEVNSEDITGKNYKNKSKSVKFFLNDWSFRSLSLIGKVCIIKTLALPFFIQIFTVLPVPSEQIVKEIETIFFDFIWDKKGDKIKRSVMINNKDEGGLQAPHIPSFCAALKPSWLKKILDVNYFYYLDVNTVWINVFEAWAKFELPLPQPQKKSCHKRFGQTKI